MTNILARPGVVGGWFPQRIEGGGALLRFGARGANRRARWLDLPYGDQAIFTTRSAFEEVGGFPEEPLFEDAGLARRLRRLGRLEPAGAAVTTGTEHWQRLGAVPTAILDYLTLGAWLAGVAPEVDRAALLPAPAGLPGTGASPAGRTRAP